VRRLFSRARATEVIDTSALFTALSTFASIFGNLGNTARCSVLWMLTEFHDEFPVIYPDFLRKLDYAEIFGKNGCSLVQGETLLLSSKVWHYHVRSGKDASTSNFFPFFTLFQRSYLV